jgi:hypothetical protein
MCPRAEGGGYEEVAMQDGGGCIFRRIHAVAVAGRHECGGGRDRVLARLGVEDCDEAVQVKEHEAFVLARLIVSPPVSCKL